MNGFLEKSALIAAAGTIMAAAANASEVLVTSDIASSTTWTSNNTYNLQDQIYVLPGATLTIQAGTVVASTTNLGGSLCVTRGAQIMVMGTATNPVIMTSKADTATWVGGDPKTGTWRVAANEWGNLTLEGEGFVSENATVGNVPTCNPNNVAAMEGLIAAFPGDQNVLYGGGDDNDDSGTIHYLSLRYGGKVIGLNNELNGLSLGGIGRGTDIDHIEIMNNVDDGVEIWGGTVNIKHISIWNVGDDSFDVDQGWRGKAQFGLIVQGYSLDASQGSGVGDNGFETDGAEDSDWQPVSTAVIYNFTFIGQPLDGDGATAWRDGARIQYRNCIFMDCGEKVVRPDGDDGDGASGYGHNGTLSFMDVWATDWNAAPPHANDCPAGTYLAQTNGKLAEMRDSVFFRNLHADAYTTANAVGVFNPGNNNVLIPGFADADAPILSITRGPLVSLNGGTLDILPVINLDPRPANEALTSVGMAPNDGFFTPAHYRGGFAPAPGPTWLGDWTASYAFGFTKNEIGTNYCTSTANSTGMASTISAVGSPSISDGRLVLTADHLPTQPGIFIAGPSQANIPLYCGSLCIGFSGLQRFTSTASPGAGGVITEVVDYATSVPGGLNVMAGQTMNYQRWNRDPAGAGACNGTGTGSPNATANFSDGISILHLP